MRNILLHLLKKIKGNSWTGEVPLTLQYPPINLAELSAGKTLNDITTKIDTRSNIDLIADDVKTSVFQTILNNYPKIIYYWLKTKKNKS